jgi:hypothetical protein
MALNFNRDPIKLLIPLNSPLLNAPRFNNQRFRQSLRFNNRNFPYHLLLQPIKIQLIFLIINRSVQKSTLFQIIIKALLRCFFSDFKLSNLIRRLGQIAAQEVNRKRVETAYLLPSNPNLRLDFSLLFFLFINAQNGEAIP